MPLKPLRVVGIRHAAYYAPQLVASRLGFLHEEGLSLEYVPGVPGFGLAEEVAAGRADVVLGGIWRPARYLEAGHPFVAFGQLNGHCDFQVIGRANKDQPLAADARVLVTTTLAPSPWFALAEWFIRKGLDTNRLRLIPALPIEEARRLFIEGGAELIEIEDIEAAPLLDGRFHVLASWPEDIGALPWGVYYTTRSWLTSHRSEALSLLRALARAKSWIASQTATEVTEALLPDFPAVSSKELENLVELYMGRQAMWLPDVQIPEEAYGRWCEILVRRGWLTQPPAYNELVDFTLAADVGTEAA
jgi:NitT/TauT family transport system substrate-binding protein